MDSKVLGRKRVSILRAAVVLVAAVICLYFALIAASASALALWQVLLAGWLVAPLSLIIGLAAAYLFGPLVWGRFSLRRGLTCASAAHRKGAQW